VVASFDLWLLKVGREVVPVDSETEPTAGAPRLVGTLWAKGACRRAELMAIAFPMRSALTRGRTSPVQGRVFAKNRYQIDRTKEKADSEHGVGSALICAAKIRTPSSVSSEAARAAHRFPVLRQNPRMDATAELTCAGTQIKQRRDEAIGYPVDCFRVAGCARYRVMAAFLASVFFGSDFFGSDFSPVDFLTAVSWPAPRAVFLELREIASARPALTASSSGRRRAARHAPIRQ